MRVPQPSALQRLGNVSWQTWRGILHEANSPILKEGTLPYNAAEPYTALCLACMKLSTNFGTLATEITRTKNPFMLRNEGSFSGLMEFPTWEDAIIYWKRHVFPSTETHQVESLWEIVRLAELYTTADQDRVYAVSVSGYLNEDGQPLDETYRRWFGMNTESQELYRHAFFVWKDWCMQRGVYPSWVWTTVLNDGAYELSFSNGLRIYDNGETAYVVGDVQY